MIDHFNRSHTEHVVISLIIQVVIGILTGNWWAGAAAGSYFFVGREVAQAEYRWIKAFGEGKRENMPWYGGLDHKVWSWPKESDSWLDWVLPVLFTVAVAILTEVI